MLLQHSSGKSRRILSAALAVIIVLVTVLCYGFGLYHYESDQYLKRQTVTLAGYNKEVTGNLIRSSAFLDEYFRLASNSYFVYLRIAMLDWISMTGQSLSELVSSGDLDNSGLYSYVLNAALEPVDSFGDLPFSLSDEECRQLIEHETLQIGSMYYIAEKVDDFYYVLGVQADEISYDHLSSALSHAVPYFILDRDTGEFLSVSSDDSAASMSDAILSRMADSPYASVDGIDVYRLNQDGGQYLVAVQSVDANPYRCTVCTLSDIRALMEEARFGALSSSAILLVFFLSCVAAVSLLKKKKFADYTIPQTGVFHFRRHYTFRQCLIRTVALLGALFLISSTMLHFLQNILLIQAEITVAMEDLVALDDACEKNRNTVYREASQLCFALLQVVEDALQYRYDMDQDEWLQEVATYMAADELSCLDENGVIVASSGPYVGYRLSSYETDEEYQLWQLLKGSAKTLAYYSESEGLLTSAKRRTDGVGILLMKTNGSILAQLWKTIEFSSLVKEHDYACASKFYFMRNQPETLYILQSGSQIEKTSSNMLPFLAEGETFIGMRTIDGQTFFCINAGGSDWVAMYAYPMKELRGSVLLFVSISLAAMLIIGAAVLLFLFLQKEGGSAADCPATYQEFSAAAEKLFPHIQAGLAIVSIMVLSTSNTYTGNVLALFQFFSGMETGFNLISCTYILLASWITWGVLQLIAILSGVIRKRMNPRRSTIFSLFISILNVAIVVTLVIAILERLGVNATAITASLGLSGLALGIGSKDVISDLVAGIFIIFEGNIQIGDLITVNGFTGKVTSLNIRTATVKFNNQEMIINNTNLRNVLNKSRGKALLKISFVVPNQTDLDHLQQVIEASAQRFMDVCGGDMLTLPFFCGVSEFVDYGIKCSITAFVDNTKITPCTNRCQSELKKILDENHIALAEKK